MKSNNLKTKIWSSLIIFSVIILCFLWFFQVLFLNSYYEWQKTKEMKKIVNKIRNNYKKESFEEILDNITFNKGVCIEIIDKTVNSYSSNSKSRGCIMDKNFEIERLKQDFINSNDEQISYKVKNNQFKNNTLFSAIKLDNNTYAFVNVSLQPLDSTIKILSSQLLIVTIVVLILSFLIAYFISKNISKPISKITLQAKELSKGNYNISFDNTSIEEINELSNTLNQAKDTMIKTEEIRKELLANVSHDLKTPLTMIKAYAEMVRDITYKDKDKREKNLNTIIDETDRLTLLVNDILELSKIESLDKLEIEEFDLNNLIKKIITKFDYLKERDNYILIFNESKNIKIKADKKRIEQVIYNLISNAINYVGKDKTIIINLINKDDITVEVTDHGKGIDEKEINNIWNKYYKIDKQHQRNRIGTGLGLSIVKSILEQHNFEYGVKSIKGKGTTFYFKIEK